MFDEGRFRTEVKLFFGSRYDNFVEWILHLPFNIIYYVKVPTKLGDFECNLLYSNLITQRSSTCIKLQIFINHVTLFVKHS